MKIYNKTLKTIAALAIALSPALASAHPTQTPGAHLRQSGFHDRSTHMHDRGSVAHR